MTEPQKPSSLDRAIGLSARAIVWEKAWPPLAALLTLAGLFLVLAWLGLWVALPAYARLGGLILFGAVALVLAFPLLRIRMPARIAVLQRIDRDSGLVHRPATAVTDKLATTGEDPLSAALWRAHLERALLSAKNLRAARPAPRLAARDPIALRGLVVVMLVASFFVAGNDRWRRVAAAFDLSGAVPVSNYRIDAWVTPPPYTGRAPVILPGLRPGESSRAQAAIVVPAGSVLVIRAAGSGLTVTTKGGLAEKVEETKTDDEAKPAAAPASTVTRAAAGSEERRYVISGNGEASIRGGLSWTFVAVPDNAPKISLTKEPEPQARGALQLTYTLEDDYGVTEATATFARPEQTAQGRTARPLFGAPDFPLVMPQARTRNGAGQTTKDLSEHPWAGADVTLTLTARDEGGNEGKSEPLTMQIPQRPFGKPLARALIEQRRVLSFDAEAKPTVTAALDALAIAPEKFIPEAGIYLGLRSIYWQLQRAKSDDALRDVVARLWQMAVIIEDGNVSDAEAALRQAQEQLRDALDRNASDEEIKRLTDQLRAALDKFLQALAEEMRKNPQSASRPLDQNARVMRPQDLKSMIDRMENLARSGAKDAAKRMLQELQQMLENLQTAQRGQQQGDQDGDDMMSKLDELSDMIRRQQQLRDRTFREGQESRRERQQRGQQGQQGQQGEQGQQQRRQGQQNFGELRQNQQALRDQLNKLLEEMRKRGMGQDGQDGQDGDGQQGQQGQGQAGMDQLGRAGDAMGDAEGALGEGAGGEAVDAQGRALDAMRKGAQGMAQSMQQQQGMGPGPGQPGRTGPPGRAEQQTDPLGRPLRGRDYGDDVTVKVPGEIDVQRARRILEELRKRFGDTFRPQGELDYIERLLRDF